MIERERTILHALVGGQSLQEVAKSLGISPYSAEQHMRRAFSKLGVDGLPAAAKVLLDSGSVAPPKSESPKSDDLYAREPRSRASSSDIVTGRIALPVQPQQTGKVPTKTLVEMLVTADKHALIEDGSEQGSTALRRDEAKRISRGLLENPFTPMLDVANEGMTSERRVELGQPFYTQAGLQRLHSEFPNILPDPRMLGKSSEVIETEAVKVLLRARSLETSGPGLDAGTALTLGLVRGVADRLPATAGTQRLLSLFNVYSKEELTAVLKDAFGALGLDAGEVENRVSRKNVAELMAKYPVESGASGLEERAQLARDAVKSALSKAKPSDNLYSVMEGAAENLAMKLPAHAKAVSAEDLMRLVSGDAALVGDLVKSRRSDEDRALAVGLMKTIGRSKIAKMPVDEIVRTMRDAAFEPIHNPYDDVTVRRLLTDYASVFGLKPKQQGTSEFLLANQVGDAMSRMFPGATLDDVAEFLSKKTPGFSVAYPGFSAADIRMLQRAFSFLPQWESKSTEPEVPSRHRLSTDGLAKLAGAGLSPQGASDLQKAVMESLADGLKTGKVPKTLEKQIDDIFKSELVRSTIKAITENGPSSRPSKNALIHSIRAPAGERTKSIEAALGDGSEPPDVVMQRIQALGADERTARKLVRATTFARAFDVEKLLEQNIGGMNTSSFMDSYMEAFRTKVSLLALGRESIFHRVEADIFQNKELKESFQRFSRIPLRLPMIQKVVDKYKDQRPFTDTNVMMVQHMLGQTYPQVAGYVQLGMDPKNAILVGVPYHRNVEVEEAVAGSFGVDVRVPPRDVPALKAMIRKSVDDLVAKHKENGKPCLVVCDGPEARTHFLETWAKKEPKLLEAFRFTEQTAFGDRPEYRKLKLRVVSYARTGLKTKEARFIGQSIARAFQAQLNKLGTGYEEKSVLIRGLGSVGWATAAAFAGDRAKVSVYDPKLDKSSPHYDEVTAAAWKKQAEELGYKVLDKREDAATGYFLDVGCSGYCSIDEQELLAAQSGAIKGSGSSKQAEIAMEKLRDLATDEQGRVRKIKVSEVNDQETWSYWLRNGNIVTVVADGFPANFNDINVVPPEFIDTTMSLSLAAAVQTMKKKDLVFEDLNEEDHTMLEGHFESYLDKLENQGTEGQTPS